MVVANATLRESHSDLVAIAMHSVSTLFVAALLAPVEALVLTTGARPSPTAMARSRNILLEEPPPPPSGGRLGGTIDQDGKSNVWLRILHTYGHDSAAQPRRRRAE